MRRNPLDTESASVYSRNATRDARQSFGNRAREFGIPWECRAAIATKTNECSISEFHGVIQSFRVATIAHATIPGEYVFGEYVFGEYVFGEYTFGNTYAGRTNVR